MKIAHQPKGLNHMTTTNQPSRYEIWNAWVHNGWTIRETSQQMGVTQKHVREVLRSYGERGDRRR